MLRFGVNGSYTFSIGDELYTIDNDLYDFDTEESYKNGVYVIYNDLLYKVKEFVQGETPSESNKYQVINSHDYISNYASTDDIVNLNNKVKKLDTEVVKTVNGIKPTNGDITIIGDGGGVLPDNVVKYSEINGKQSINLKQNSNISITDKRDTAHFVFYLDNSSDSESLKIGSSDIHLDLLSSNNATLNGSDQIITNSQLEQKLSDLDIPDTNSFATKNDVETLTNDLSETKTELNQVNSSLSDINSKYEQLNSSVVKYTPFSDRKTIQLNNYDTVSGIDTSGTAHNLAMVSKWNIADFGAKGLHFNLNTKDNVTINDKNIVATIDDLNSLGIVNLGNFATAKEAEDRAKDIGFQKPNIAIITYTVDNLDTGIIHNNVIQNTTYQTLWYRDKVKTRIIKTDSTSDWIDAANKPFVSNASVSINVFKLNTSSSDSEIKACFKLNGQKLEDVLDKCYVYGYSLNYDTLGGHVSVGWTGQAYSLTCIAQKTPKTLPCMLHILIKPDFSGGFSVVRDAINSEVLLASTLESQPAVIKLNSVEIPISTLEDRVYSKSEILQWFGITDENSLKELIQTNKSILLVDITNSDTPARYSIPVQYIGYESSTQLKMIGYGINKSNKKFSKYDLLINLDGVIIESNKNVKLTLTALEN